MTAGWRGLPRTPHPSPLFPWNTLHQSPRPPLFLPLHPIPIDSMELAQLSVVTLLSSRDSKKCVLGLMQLHREAAANSASAASLAPFIVQRFIAVAHPSKGGKAEDKDDKPAASTKKPAATAEETERGAAEAARNAVAAPLASKHFTARKLAYALLRHVPLYGAMWVSFANAVTHDLTEAVAQGVLSTNATRGGGDPLSAPDSRILDRQARSLAVAETAVMGLRTVNAMSYAHADDFVRGRWDMLIDVLARSRITTLRLAVLTLFNTLCAVGPGSEPQEAATRVLRWLGKARFVDSFRHLLLDVNNDVCVSAWGLLSSILGMNEPRSPIFYERFGQTSTSGRGAAAVGGSVSGGIAVSSSNLVGLLGLGEQLIHDALSRHAALPQHYQLAVLPVITSLCASSPASPAARLMSLADRSMGPALVQSLLAPSMAFVASALLSSALMFPALGLSLSGYLSTALGRLTAGLAWSAANRGCELPVSTTSRFVSLVHSLSRVVPRGDRARCVAELMTALLGSGGNALPSDRQTRLPPVASLIAQLIAFLWFESILDDSSAGIQGRAAGHAGGDDAPGASSGAKAGAASKKAAVSNALADWGILLLPLSETADDDELVCVVPAAGDDELIDEADPLTVLSSVVSAASSLPHLSTTSPAVLRKQALGRLPTLLRRPARHTDSPATTVSGGGGVPTVAPTGAASVESASVDDGGLDEAANYVPPNGRGGGRGGRGDSDDRSNSDATSRSAPLSRGASLRTGGAAAPATKKQQQAAAIAEILRYPPPPPASEALGDCFYSLLTRRPAYEVRLPLAARALLDRLMDLSVQHISQSLRDADASIRAHATSRRPMSSLNSAEALVPDPDSLRRAVALVIGVLRLSRTYLHTVFDPALSSASRRKPRGDSHAALLLSNVYRNGEEPHGIEPAVTRFLDVMSRVVAISRRLLNELAVAIDDASVVGSQRATGGGGPSPHAATDTGADGGSWRLRQVGQAFSYEVKQHLRRLDASVTALECALPAGRLNTAVLLEPLRVVGACRREAARLLETQMARYGNAVLCSVVVERTALSSQLLCTHVAPLVGSYLASVVVASPPKPGIVQPAPATGTDAARLMRCAATFREFLSLEEEALLRGEAAATTATTAAVSRHDEDWQSFVSDFAFFYQTLHSTVAASRGSSEEPIAVAHRPLVSALFTALHSQLILEAANRSGGTSAQRRDLGVLIDPLLRPTAASCFLPGRTSLSASAPSPSYGLQSGSQKFSSFARRWRSVDLTSANDPCLIHLAYAVTSPITVDVCVTITNNMPDLLLEEVQCDLFATTGGNRALLCFDYVGGGRRHVLAGSMEDTQPPAGNNTVVYAGNGSYTMHGLGRGSTAHVHGVFCVTDARVNPIDGKSAETAERRLATVELLASSPRPQDVSDPRRRLAQSHLGAIGVRVTAVVAAEGSEQRSLDARRQKEASSLLDMVRKKKAKKKPKKKLTTTEVGMDDDDGDDDDGVDTTIPTRQIGWEQLRMLPISLSNAVMPCNLSPGTARLTVVAMQNDPSWLAHSLPMPPRTLSALRESSGNAPVAAATPHDDETWTPSLAEACDYLDVRDVFTVVRLGAARSDQATNEEEDNDLAFQPAAGGRSQPAFPSVVIAIGQVALGQRWDVDLSPFANRHGVSESPRLVTERAVTCHGEGAVPLLFSIELHVELATIIIRSPHAALIEALVAAEDLFPLVERIARSV
mgnify:CR=1 FL=1